MNREIKQILHAVQQIEQMMVLLVEKQVGGGVGRAGGRGFGAEYGGPTGSADFLQNYFDRSGPQRGGPDPTGTQRRDAPYAGPDPTGVQPDELMTIREAYLELNVSRTTINKLRKQGDLTSYYHNNNVRLLRSEVMAAKHWYSSMKGKL